MEKRLYFLFGDLLGNVLTGVIAAPVCVWLLGGLAMWLSMPVSMIVGMAIAMVLCFAILIRLFGAMELMIQGLQARSIMPKQVNPLRQHREKLFGVMELIFIGPIETDDDMRQIIGVLQVIQYTR